MFHSSARPIEACPKRGLRLPHGGLLMAVAVLCALGPGGGAARAASCGTLDLPGVYDAAVSGDGRIVALLPDGALLSATAPGQAATARGQIPDGAPLALLTAAGGAVYSLSVCRSEAGPLQRLKSFPAPPPLVLRPVLWSVSERRAAPVAGPPFDEIDGAAPLPGAGALFVGRRSGELIAANHRGEVWKRTRSPEGHAALGWDEGGSLYLLTSMVASGHATIFAPAGNVVRDRPLQALLGTRFRSRGAPVATFAGSGRESAVFWLTGLIDDPRTRRPSTYRAILTLTRGGDATLSEVPVGVQTALRDCAVVSVAYASGRFAATCAKQRMDDRVIYLWPLGRTDAEIVRPEPLAGTAGRQRSEARLSARDADFVLSEFHSGGVRSQVLSTGR
jgi:hypothetical protein